MTLEPFIQRVVVVDGQAVPCRFFKPVPDRGDFRCRIEVLWPEGVYSKEIYGVDEVQALLLAMQTAHTELLVAREHGQRTILWLGERELGLPAAPAVSDWASNKLYNPSAGDK